ncbi:hypothetical protein AGOR_G00067310 [Albula goreensis]|uniref:Uncharacterized protein n=1 Tax=Albula goreensis TaxID=1534307 RepID=A0A8T3DUB3_9TELE|nr:hypothetical protein AGOR_G00067310 [Albula goreensis]
MIIFKESHAVMSSYSHFYCRSFQNPISPQGLDLSIPDFARWHLRENERHINNLWIPSSTGQGREPHGDRTHRRAEALPSATNLA